MPTIEVLPNSTSTTTPGWAYVPDTGYDPSKAPIQPTGVRKRAARNAGVGGDTTGARQNTAVLKHLAELDKDNHRDVHIPVPVRQRDGAGRVSKGKVTQAVRRILISQKTFANHIADEEAALASHSQQQTAAPAPRRVPAKNTKAGAARTKRASTSMSTSTPAPADSAAQPALPDPAAMDGVVHTSASAPQQSLDDDDPLLKSYVPSAPSEATMHALITAPALSYNMARSRPPQSGKPERHFCEICGYWGRVKCMKCGARVCGLECKSTHDEGRCLRFYA